MTEAIKMIENLVKCSSKTYKDIEIRNSLEKALTVLKSNKDADILNLPPDKLFFLNFSVNFYNDLLENGIITNMQKTQIMKYLHNNL